MKQDASVSSQQFQVQLQHFDAGLGRTGLLAEHAGVQAASSERAANAAKSAAETAKDALHMTERAYVITGVIVPDFDKQKVVVLRNKFRPYSLGKVEIIAHSVLFEDIPPSLPTNARPIEWSWTRREYKTIAPNTPISMEPIFPKMSSVKMNTAHQAILVVGYISYNDGFENTPQQRWDFCLKSEYSIAAKSVSIAACDSNQGFLWSRSWNALPLGTEAEIVCEQPLKAALSR